MSARILTPVAALIATTLLVAAAPLGDEEVPQAGELGGPTMPLNRTEMAIWLAGLAQFDRNFVVADGVGAPEMNADSCRGCHQDPVTGGAGGLELNVARFGFDNGGLGPFQNLPGGQAASKLRPPPIDDREDYPPQADVFEQRQTPSVLGLGLLDAIIEADILANEDPTDTNGDGIAGVARIIMINGLPEVGKFGWKAQAPKLADFIRDAMGGENGITTPDDGRGFAMVSDADSVPDPEFTQDLIDDMAFYLGHLGPPLRVGSTAPDVLQGEVLFNVLMCDRCHIPNINVLAQPVYAYTDLLLHDVMPPDYRGMEEPGAGAGVFRTPPLWGIRHTAPYMHDGRAEDLTQAVMAHDSEGLASSTAFALLDQNTKDALIAFLNDL
jgi:hypothetical protein